MSVMDPRWRLERARRSVEAARDREIAGQDSLRGDRQTGLRVRRVEAVQPLYGAAEALRPSDHQRLVAAQRQQVPGSSPRERALRLDDQQAVERFRGHLDAELAHRLVTAIAGEQQQPVPFGLQHVDRVLHHLADPRAGKRRDQHADHLGTSAGQAHSPGTGHVTQFLDDFADPRGRGLVQLTLAVAHAGHGRFADLSPGRNVGDGDRHWSSKGIRMIKSRFLDRFRDRCRQLTPVTRLTSTH